MALGEGARGLWRIEEALKVFLKTIGEGDDSQGEGLTGFIRWG